MVILPSQSAAALAQVLECLPEYRVVDMCRPSQLRIVSVCVVFVFVLCCIRIVLYDVLCCVMCCVILSVEDKQQYW